MRKTKHKDRSQHQSKCTYKIYTLLIVLHFRFLCLSVSLCIAVDCLRPMNNDDDATVAVDDDYEETESFFATFKKQDRMKIPPRTITKKY